MEKRQVHRDDGLQYMAFVQQITFNLRFSSGME